jgi:uncharacterized protein YbjT (DUF2867 family)
MILVTGATGNAGSQVVRALVERGHQVRAFVRDPRQARRLFGDAVELSIGDFANQQSVNAALEGVQELVLSCADDPRRVEWEKGVIDVAAAAEVGRIVKLSSIAAEPGAPVAFWDWHGQVEQHLRRSRVPSVVLRSSFYMSNVVAAAEQVARDGRLYAPVRDARIAMIDPRDVGAAAAAVVTTAGHDGRTYELTGPEAITYAQLAAELWAAIGREIRFIDVPDEDAKDQMIRAGVPEFTAGQIVRLFAMLRAGVAEQVTATVESLTGRPPRDFASFVSDHADLFAPAAIGAGR